MNILHESVGEYVTSNHNKEQYLESGVNYTSCEQDVTLTFEDTESSFQK
jgi:hypothetical protein